MKKCVIQILGVFSVLLEKMIRALYSVPPTIYFYYDQSIHHIYHSLFIAIELSNFQNKYPVVVLSTSREATEIIEKELRAFPCQVKLKKIYHLGYNRTDMNVSWNLLWARWHIVHPAAIIVTDYYDNVWRQLKVKTFWVCVNHGGENRGFSHPHIRDYDLMIGYGPGDLARIQTRIGTLPHCEVLGYPKFDYLLHHPMKKEREDVLRKPVIIYNPHFEPGQSSFFVKGKELLAALSQTGRYRILFMPHPDLSRRFSTLLDPARRIPGIEVVERPAVNLDLFASADIYITDVSSAALEWLAYDKPVVFFNAHGWDWQKEGLFPAWRCGPVGDTVEQVLQAVEDSLRDPSTYHLVRQEFLEQTFTNRGQNVSRLVAESVMRKIGY